MIFIKNTLWFFSNKNMNSKLVRENDFVIKIEIASAVCIYKEDL